MALFYFNYFYLHEPHVFLQKSFSVSPGQSFLFNLIQTELSSLHSLLLSSSLILGHCPHEYGQISFLSFSHFLQYLNIGKDLY
jgi:hypothetical protein